MENAKLLAVWKNTHVGQMIEVLNQEIMTSCARTAESREWNVHARAEWLRQSIETSRALYSAMLTVHPFDDLLSTLDELVDVDLTFPYVARQDTCSMMSEMLRALHERYLSLLEHAGADVSRETLEEQLAVRYDEAVTEWQQIVDRHYRLVLCRDRSYNDLAQGQASAACERISKALHPSAG